MIYYAPLVAAIVAAFSISALLASGFGRKVQDIPNERSLHAIPVPRIGGVGLIAGVAAGWAITGESLIWWMMMPLLLLFLVSLLDDVRGLPVRLRLPAHFAAAALLAAGSGLASKNPLLAVLVLLFAVWMTNLYNFMDGSDGLAGGMALFGFSAYGVAWWMRGDEAQAISNLSIAAAALGFLRYNFPPARVFMGDAGSIPLGFLAAAMGLWGWQQGAWTWWFPLLVFSPFVADASATLAKRTLRGARITEAHREHYYQRAIRMGRGHRDTALAEYTLMLLAGGSALWGLGLGHATQAGLLLGWCGIYLALMRWLDRRWREYQAAEMKVAGA